MKKQKTVFKKYLSVFMLIVFFSFFILGTMLWIFVSDYWKTEKKELLTKNATGISHLISQNSKHAEDSIYIVNSLLMQGFLNTFSSNINADIFISDSRGNVILHSDYTKNRYNNSKIPQDILDNAMKGEYTGDSYLGEIYSGTHYVVALPIFINDERGSQSIGAVFTAIDYDYLNSFRTDILKMFFFAMLITFFIAFVVIGFLSYNMTRPLKQMATAAKCFGQGDFSKRVIVKSDDELGQLASEFNNMANSLASSEEIRRTFIANVSHELKTPMTTISGFIDGILDGTIKDKDKDIYLNVISNEIKRLSRIVKSMLNLSRIDNGEIYLNKTSFDLLGIIINVLMSFEQIIEQKNIKITGLDSSKSTFIDGDPDMIHQVIYNLIENAVKFVNIDGFIEMKLCSTGEKVMFSIKNSGEGISPDDINLIFDKFYKTDKSRSQDKTGLGLGLYIVKKILRLHGGEIIVKSKESDFCEFIFYLPIAKV